MGWKPPVRTMSLATVSISSLGPMSVRASIFTTAIGLRLPG